MTFAFAAGLDAATVQLHQLPGYGKPKPKATVTACSAGLGLPEAVEHVRKKLLADADTRVSHPDFHHVAIAARVHFDTATGGSEFDGIAQQVPHNLLDPVRVGANDTDII